MSNCFPPLQENSLKYEPENSNGSYNPAFLFICQSAVAYSKVKPKHKTLLVEWVLRGLWSKMKIRSLFKKERERKKKKTTPLTQCIVTHLKTSLCSLNVLLRALTGQSTGNARIRYILIRAHKTLSRMLCCPGECSEQGTFTNSRSVSPLHHCEKKKFMRLNYMDVIYWNC